MNTRIRIFLLLSLVLALFTACKREEIQKGSAAVTTAAPDAAVAVAVAVPAATAPSKPGAADAVAADGGIAGLTVVKKIIVRREGTPMGVSAEIFLRDKDSHDRYFSSTDSSGVATPNQPCMTTDRFKIKARSAGMLETGLKPCSETIEVEVPSAQVTYAMVRLGSDALQRNDFAKAQAYYAEAAQRLEYHNGDEALFLSNQAKIAAGKALGQDAPTENKSGVEVFTAATAAKLRSLQAARGINASGTLDQATRELISNIKSPALLKEAVKVPSIKTDEFKWTPPTSTEKLIEYKKITKAVEPQKFTFDPKAADASNNHLKAASEFKELKAPLAKTMDFKSKAGALDDAPHR